MDELIEGALDGGQGGQVLDHGIAQRLGLARLHGLAVDDDGSREQVAFIVRVALIELGRQAMREVVEDVLARRDVDGKIASFAGGDVGKTAHHQRFGRRDDLHDRRAAGREIGLDGGDQARQLHRRDQVIEEALLVGFERRARRGLRLPIERTSLAGDVGRLQRRIEIVMDDLKGAGIGIVDADLLRRQRMLKEVDLDAVIGERARRVEAERLEVARQHLHGGDAAFVHGRDELGTRRERKIIAAPKSQALRVAEVLDGRGSRRRHIDDAGIGQGVLQLA